jgi:hypothetical protein
MNTVIRSALVIALLPSCLLLLGCNKGPEIVPVSGQVLIDGKPLEHGYIRVLPTGGRAAQAEIRKEGKFTLTTKVEGDGCLLGTHVVAIIALEIIGPGKQRWHAPNKYRKAKTSGLTVQIDGPTDDLTVELTWDGGKPFIDPLNGG